MKKGATYSTVETCYEEENPNVHWDEGYIYKVLQCPSCSNLTLTEEYYSEAIPDEDLPAIKILYPTNDKLPIGMPEAISKAYEAALKVRSIDANAYGVLIGRMLEMVCEDRNAKGRDLNSKLADLATRGEIPNNLVGVADGLRNLRNVGAHAGLGELTLDEVPILGSLAKAIIEYVYSAPHLARMAQEKLDELKGKRKS